jgi:hypothetical protein
MRRVKSTEKAIPSQRVMVEEVVDFMVWFLLLIATNPPDLRAPPPNSVEKFG